MTDDITSDLAGVVWQPSRMASSFTRGQRLCRGCSALLLPPCHTAARNNLPSVFCPLSSERGFSLISAIFLLVVIAALGTFAVTLSTTQHQSAAMDVMGSRAYQAARAGIEWAAYHVSRTAPGVEWTGCTATPPATQFPVNTLGGTLSPFAVDVYCARMAVSEVGASPTDTIWIYDLSASAVTGGNPGDQNYIERVISVKMGK